MATKNLTDTQLKSVKPKDKPFKISDGTVPGLFVYVPATGTKIFRLKYSFQGKEQLLTLGHYPAFSLAEAREAALGAKKMLAHGQNPAAAKKEAMAKAASNDLLFKTIAHQWLELKKPEWSKVHLDDTLQKLNLHILPHIGHYPIAEVDKAKIKTILDSLQAQNKFATLKKVRSAIAQIIQYALDLEIHGVVDCTNQLRRQYSSPAAQNRAAITKPGEVGGLMKSIEAYKEVSLMTALALKFSALTFCRPGEIRRAEWAEIDLENSLWRIPASKMKSGQPHTVPLASQTIELLAALKPITGHSIYLFPSTRSVSQPMSEMTVTAALRRMGYAKEEMCAHGFRGMASTLLNEKGYNRDWVERQLAHGPRDKVRAAYNHAEFLPERRKMMQEWADYIDELKGES